MTTKSPLSVYLEPDLKRALDAYADRRGQSRSLIAEAAIASFLSPDADEQREAAISKRLDRLDRRMTRLERDVGIGVEMIAMFSASGFPIPRRRPKRSEPPCAGRAVIATTLSWRRLAADSRRVRRSDRKSARTFLPRKNERTTLLPVFLRQPTTTAFTC